MVKLLDSTGLAQLWHKIKGSFLSNKGGIINSEKDDEGLTIQNVGEGYTIFCPQGMTTYNDDREIVSSLEWGDLLLNRIHLKNGTSSQVLIADGSVKTSFSVYSTNPVQNKVVSGEFNKLATAWGAINQSITNLNYTVLTSSEIDAILV